MEYKKIMENQKGEFALKMFNMGFKCGKCGEVHNIRSQVPYVVTQVAGFNRLPSGEFTPVFGSLIICKVCFKALQFQEKEILLATVVPGKIIKN